MNDIAVAEDGDAAGLGNGGGEVGSQHLERPGDGVIDKHGQGDHGGEQDERESQLA